MSRIQKCGQPPGTLEYTGLKKGTPIYINVIDYNKDVLTEKRVEDIDELKTYKERPTITWVNIDGLHDVSVVERIGDIFGLHPLVMEDILHTDQRAKIDIYDDYIYIIVKMLNYNEKQDSFESEQLSLVFGRNFVLSFQEEPGDAFDIIRSRLRKNHKTREKGPDYLAYSLMDLIIDTYFKMMERMGEWIEDLEAEIVDAPSKNSVLKVNDLKHDLTFLRRNIWPMREVVHAMERHEEGLISPDTVAFIRDAYDHVVQVIDNIENYRDMLGNLMDLYLSNLSYKMNDVMKTLTIIATIFIPITFITSVYGMNFKYMPELDTQYGYFAVWAIIAVTVICMVIYFRRKRWL